MSRLGLFGLGLGASPLGKPLTITPSASSVNMGDTVTFTIAGGTGAGQVKSAQTNASGGRFVSGNWVPGPLGGSDVIKVVDSGNNQATCTLTVTSPAGLVNFNRPDLGVTATHSPPQDGDTISAYADQSSAGISTYTQATSAQRPTYKASGINGFPDISYSGSTWFIGSITPLGTTALTIAAIFKSTNVAAETTIFGMFDNQNHYDISLETSGKIKAKFGTPTGATAALSNASLADGNPHVAIATWSTADNTVRLYIDGVLQTTTGTNANTIAAGSNDVTAIGAEASTTNTGASTFGKFIGEIADTIAYSNVPISGDLTKITNYLRAMAGV